MFTFLDFDVLTDNEIDLIIEKKIPEDGVKGYVPVYEYRITLHGSQETVGRIGLRIGYNENLWYGGNIGYEIDENHRGRHFAAKACRLVRQVALAHGMRRLIITCNPENLASRKTCAHIGAKLMEVVDLPPHNDQYRRGERQKCIYEWNLEETENFPVIFKP